MNHYRLMTVLFVSIVLVTWLPTAGGSATNQATDQAGPVTLVDSTGATIDQDSAEYFVRVRLGFGFPADAVQVQQILDEYGIAYEWGFPVTPSELAELERRLAVADQITDEVLDGIRALPGYAGFYFDHQHGGTPTVLTTRLVEARATVAQSVSASLAGELGVVGAEYTWSELEVAAWAIAESEDPYLSQVHRVAIKTASNSLEASIADQSMLGKVAEAVALVTSVPVAIVVEPVSEALSCSSRTICYDPHKGGIQVNGGPGVSTLGFGLNHDGDRQYAVIGHHTGASTYTHYIFTLGSTAESEYFDNGIDVRAVYAPDSQVSDDIYISSTFARDILGSKYPSVGLTVCKTGVTTNVTCGTIVDDYLIYSTSGGVSGLTGASANFTAQEGDSGAPVYQISGSSSAWAVGMVSTGTGDIEFVRTYDFWARMGASVLTS